MKLLRISNKLYLHFNIPELLNLSKTICCWVEYEYFWLVIVKYFSQCRAQQSVQQGLLELKQRIYSNRAQQRVQQGLTELQQRISSNTAQQSVQQELLELQQRFSSNTAQQIVQQGLLELKQRISSNTS